MVGIGEITTRIQWLGVPYRRARGRDRPEAHNHGPFRRCRKYAQRSGRSTVRSFSLAGRFTAPFVTYRRVGTRAAAAPMSVRICLPSK